MLYSIRTNGYTAGSGIHKLTFGNGHTEILPLNRASDVISLEFDYHNDCIYWVDGHARGIQVIMGVYNIEP